MPPPVGSGGFLTAELQCNNDPEQDRTKERTGYRKVPSQDRTVGATLVVALFGTATGLIRARLRRLRKELMR